MIRTLFALTAALVLAAPAQAASPAAPLMKLLASGRVPPERLPAFVEMIAQRGDSSDLAYLFKQATAEDGFQGEARLTALRGLAEAAINRNVKPSGDASPLGRFIQPQGKLDPRTRLAAIELAGALAAEPLSQPLQAVALDGQAPQSVREAAVEALVRIGGPASRKAIEALSAADQPRATRVMGMAALAQFDADAAAQQAAALLASSSEQDDPAPLLQPFFTLQGGPEKLAQAITANPPAKDPAKLALRAVYAAGRTDTPLIQALSNAAGISANTAPPTPAEVEKLVAEVAASGDPARGEAVFRRADLSCMKCHSVSKAGGEIGPDLSPVGANSPVEFLVRSVLNPSQDIKEAYLTKILLTVQGKQFQGIVLDSNEQVVTIKDANGVVHKVPADDIDEEFEGKSLMPSGLANLMTRSELVDLVAFLSHLGKPGEYGIRSAETIQRWRVLKKPQPGLVKSVPSPAHLRLQVLEKGEDAWDPVYAQVNGELPLDELAPYGNVLYLKGQFEVTEGGQVGVKLNSAAGAQVWLNGEPLAAAPQATAQVARGRHALLVRVDRAERGTEKLRVELFRPDGSAAQFEAIGGK